MKRARFFSLFFSEPKTREPYNKRVRFTFRSQNPKRYDYSTRYAYDYSATAGHVILDNDRKFRCALHHALNITSVHVMSPRHL